MDNLRVVIKKLDPAIVKQKTCDFCSRTENDELQFGRLYSLEDVTGHYYCLLFASHLTQNGSDNEGIFGFMLPEMRNVLEKSKTEVCSYCNKHGASIVCVQRMCRKVFHLPCGIENGSLHHYFGRFQSFCKVHRDRPKVPQIEAISQKAAECAICLEVVKRDASCINALWAPCCKINAWLHRICVQRLALSSGYFFKCPRCNNKDIFITAMRKYGIYIPEKDASWELEPHAYEDLLHRHGRCDLEICLCPYGRDHDKDDTSWEVILCDTCGSQGAHVGCVQSKGYNIRWCCAVCTPICKKENAAEVAVTLATSSATANPAPVAAGSSNVLPERKRTAQWVDSNLPTKVVKLELGSLAASSSSREGAGGAEEDHEEDEDIEVEVVDVEEDQKTPDLLLTKDGIEIPVVTFNAPLLDNTIDITGDVDTENRIQDVEEITLSDSEDSVTLMSIICSDPETICLDD